MFDLEEMQMIQDQAVCIYTQEEVERAIDKIALKLTQKFADQTPLLICVMNGGIIFMGRLLLRLAFPLQIDYVQTSRFRGRTTGGDLQWITLPKMNLEGRTVIIVEDIIDTGETLTAVVDYCNAQKAKKVYTAVLFDKKHTRESQYLQRADCTGLSVESHFLIGYGLDYQGFFRNLPGVYLIS